jgi:nitrite reductase/ring-hydroxylating ferredoxin subunit
MLCAALMAKLTPSCFTRYAPFLLVSHRPSHGSFVNASSQGIRVACALGILHTRRSQPAELSEHLAAPGNQRRSNSAPSYSIAPQVYRNILGGRVMGASSSKIRSVQRGDIKECLTWHHVPVPPEPQSQRNFRKHICLEVCRASVAWDAVTALHSLLNAGWHRKQSPGIMQGRYITVLRHKDQWYAIDSLCYHAGGPLVRLCFLTTASHMFATASVLSQAHWTPSLIKRHRNTVM